MQAALLRNPTSCSDPSAGLTIALRADSWIHPGTFVGASFRTHAAPGYPFPPNLWGPEQGLEGCWRVPFDPSFSATPDAPAKAGSPDGFSFDLALPQSDDPLSIGESDLRTARVTLPEGVRVSPSSAHGLGACTPDEIAIGYDSEPSCPANSTIGSVTIDTPLLPKPLVGWVYLAEPFHNHFDSLLSLYVTASGFGTTIKLAGRVDADPVTGQLTATFDDNPQLPFSSLHLEFNGGPGAPLALPAQCGEYSTHAQLTGWNDKTVDITSKFTVSGDGNGAPCPGPQFSPSFRAGTENPVAARPSALHVTMSRGDVDQDLGGITVNMPNGLTGKIANVPLCDEADARAGTCPESSRVGSVTVGAGSGSNPFYIMNGRVYLTGPYKGAPFGLSIIVPAVAGPFDLGNVSVRSSIFVDKHTSDLRIVSDPLPTILQGIPLDVRDVRVNVDRQDFIVNPTSCAPKRVDGTLSSTGGMTANVSDRFQATDCLNLGFNPSMAIGVGGIGHTASGASSPLTTIVRLPKGDANLRYVRVTLPTTINARLPVIDRACTRAQFEAGHCNRAPAGVAVARTPLLKDPLRGNVYFVRNGHALPDMFIALRGQVAFDLIGRVSIPGGTRLSTTFNAVPDVPITSFALRLVPGSQGPVGAATNLCSAKARNAKAAIDFIGQNGRVKQVDQRMVIHGCPKPRARKAARGRQAASRRGR